MQAKLAASISEHICRQTSRFVWTVVCSGTWCTRYSSSSRMLSFCSVVELLLLNWSSRRFIIYTPPKQTSTILTTVDFNFSCSGFTVKKTQSALRINVFYCEAAARRSAFPQLTNMEVELLSDHCEKVKCIKDNLPSPLKCGFVIMSAIKRVKGSSAWLKLYHILWRY